MSDNPDTGANNAPEDAAAEDAPESNRYVVTHELTLNRDDGSSRTYTPGVYDDVPQKDADHWAFKAHTGRHDYVPASPYSFEHQTQTPTSTAMQRVQNFVQALEATAVVHEQHRFAETAAENRAARNVEYNKMMEEVRTGGYDAYLKLVNSVEKMADPVYIQKAGEYGASAENGEMIDEEQSDGSTQSVRKTQRATLKKS